jgi:lipid-A-disaccharide synthase-like uncharacterized protein
MVEIETDKSIVWTVTAILSTTVFSGRWHARYLYMKRSKFVKNEHAQYTVEYFPVDNMRVIYTKGLNS